MRNHNEAAAIIGDEKVRELIENLKRILNQ